MIVNTFKTFLNSCSHFSSNLPTNQNIIKFSRYPFSYNNKNNGGDFTSNTLNQGQENQTKQKEDQEKQERWGELYHNQDSIYSKLVNDQQSKTKLSEHQGARKNQPSSQHESYYNPAQYTDLANPFTNVQEDERISEWKSNFEKQHKRKPTLQDMKQDPIISSIIQGRQVERAFTSMFNYRIK